MDFFEQALRLRNLSRRRAGSNYNINNYYLKTIALLGDSYVMGEMISKAQTVMISSEKVYQKITAVYSRGATDCPLDGVVEFLSFVSRYWRCAGNNTLTQKYSEESMRLELEFARRHPFEKYYKNMPYHNKAQLNVRNSIVYFQDVQWRN